MMEIRIPPGNTTGGRNEKLDSGNVAFFTSLFPQHFKRMLGDWQLGVSFFFSCVCFTLCSLSLSLTFFVVSFHRVRPGLFSVFSQLLLVD